MLRLAFSLACSTLLVAGCRCGSSNPPPPPGGEEPAPPAKTCALPTTLDFDLVTVGDFVERTLRLENNGAAAFTAHVWQIAGGTAAFAHAPPAPGEVVVQPGQSIELAVRFTPSQPVEFLDSFEIRGVPDCGDHTVALRGTGVSGLLSWPTNFELGYTTPNTTIYRDLELTNAGLMAIEVSNLRASSAEFLLPLGTSLVVPAATIEPNGTRKPGRASVRLGFKPRVFGRHTAMLSFDLSSTGQPHGTAALGGHGGGADIDVSPQLQIGSVAYQPGSQQLFTQRKLVIRNVGTAPSPPDPIYNLHLGVAPAWSVTVSNANTELDELCVGTFDAASGACSGTLPSSIYDPAVGILAVPGVKLEIPVTVRAKTLGQKAWVVTIYSDDPDEPSVTVQVTANVQVYPPCNYSVSENALEFGLVTPPHQMLRELTVRNLGTAAGDICLLSSLDLAPGSDPVFELIDGPIFGLELGPGDSVRVPLRVRPTATPPSTLTHATGQLAIHLNNTSAPLRLIPLSATWGIGCLTVWPQTFDFGKVTVGCSSPARTFSVYNHCSFPVALSSHSLFPAGGEFHAADLTAIAPGTAVGAKAAPITFTLRYTPTGVGPDVGALLLRTASHGQVVNLSGAGVTASTTVDTFQQETNAKVDVVVLMDDSCSMANMQPGFLANTPALLEYATAANVDYQLGVVTTDGVAPTRGGKLVADPTGQAPLIIKASTPRASLAVQERLSVGTAGSATEEPAMLLQAVTPPLITSHNAGLIRPDASLSLLLFVDYDAYFSPAGYVLADFQSIKGARGPGRFTYNAISPLAATPPNACSASPGGSPKHSELASAFDGAIGDVCTTDWEATNRRVGARVFGRRSNFFLTSAVGASPLTVSIDGVPLPANDVNGNTVWSYDPLTNTLSFTESSVPLPGQSITAGYALQCVP